MTTPFPSYSGNISVESQKGKIMDPPIKNLVAQNLAAASWLLLVLIIVVIWLLWKQKKAEGYTGAGSAYITGNQQDQPYFKGSETGAAHANEHAFKEGFLNMAPAGKRMWDGFRGMGVQGYTIRPMEGFAPSMIMADEQGSYIYDNDNKGYGKIRLNGTALDSQGNPLSSLLVDAQGRQYYYSSMQADAFKFNGQTGKWDRLPALLGGVEPATQYVLAPNMPVNIAALGDSLTQAQLTDLSAQLGCSADDGASVADPWGWVSSQQQSLVHSGGSWEGMRNPDSKFIAAMNGK